jgi:hypothetical protein
MLPDKTRKSALLTKRELDWVSGNTEGISKSFEYKLKSTIRKKIQTFIEIELPYLSRSGLFPDITFAQINPQDMSLGKAKVLGPNPSQGLPLFRNEVRNEL